MKTDNGLIQKYKVLLETQINFTPWSGKLQSLDFQSPDSLLKSQDPLNSLQDVQILLEQLGSVPELLSIFSKTLGFQKGPG